MEMICASWQTARLVIQFVIDVLISEIVSRQRLK